MNLQNYLLVEIQPTLQVLHHLLTELRHLTHNNIYLYLDALFNRLVMLALFDNRDWQFKV